LEQARVRDPERIVTVLRVDQRERCRLGQWVPAKAYLDAFPLVKDDPEQAIDLVCAEYLLREEISEPPALEENLRRFPQHAEELKLQIANYQLWDLERGERVAGLPPRVTTHGFRPDERQLALEGRDGLLSLFDLPAVQLARQCNPGGIVKYLAFHPVVAQLALALHCSSEIRICVRETGRVLKTLSNPAPVDL
jgi:hypothetical protein